MDDSSGNHIINVRPRSGKFLAVRVQSVVGTDTTPGWRIMYAKGVAKKVILVPTSATRSKKHWILDNKKSITNKIVWTRAKEQMTWIALPNVVRASTTRVQADRRVSILSPALSPPLLPKGKAATAQNQGCPCALGEQCRKLRFDARHMGTLPPVDPRLAKFPSTKTV